jgi:hypothetical protein
MLSSQKSEPLKNKRKNKIRIRGLNMPLLPGKKNIGHNIKTEEKTHPKKQAIAIALNVARKSGAKISKKKET